MKISNIHWYCKRPSSQLIDNNIVIYCELCLISSKECQFTVTSLLPQSLILYNEF